MHAAVFFDLDGTLLDTAPDMVTVLNQLLAELGAAPVPFEIGRRYVSHGAAGLLALAFPEMAAAEREALRPRYLELYAARLSMDTTPFPGMLEVLDRIEAAGQRWGVVTNKPAFLTEPLMAAQGLADRCVCMVSGDTLARRKPHPEPLLHAARMAQVPAGAAVYVGDAQRDIEAGRAAGMRTVAAVYGYLGPDDDPGQWGADHAVSHPAEILDLPGIGTETQT